jgi:hypothetical protein
VSAPRFTLALLGLSSKYISWTAIAKDGSFQDQASSPCMIISGSGNSYQKTQDPNSGEGRTWHNNAPAVHRQINSRAGATSRLLRTDLRTVPIKNSVPELSKPQLR